MTHALIVAGGPVGTRMAGPAIRALEIARALHGRGVDVTLAVPGGTDLREPFALIGYDSRGASLRDAAASADALVVGGMVLARQPWLAALDVPLVVDVYGPYVLENLPASAVGGATADRRRRRHGGDVAAMVLELERGDFFLCASEKQRDFWLGALTALGRVNPATYDDDSELRRLIDVVPFGVPAEPPASAGPVLRGVVPGIEPGDLVVLWSGGLWDWLDPNTLIRATSVVAATRDRLRLFFMGARSPSPDVPPMAAYEEARSLARTLGLLDRVVFFHSGWVPYTERAAFLLESDVGASFHLPHIETRFAYRTRLLDYVWAGLPMLVTAGDVLAAEVAARGLGRVVPPGDVDAAASALATLLDESRADPTRGAAFAALRETMTWPKVVAPLAAFLDAPRRAADRPSGARLGEGLRPTPARLLPARALEALREGGPLLLVEEMSRYVRWRRRST